MRERVSDWSLKERFGAGVEWRIRGEVGIEGLECREEAGFFLWKRQRSGVVPAFTSLHGAESPVEEVSHVGENLDGLTAATVECSEGVRCVIESTGGAIGNCGKSMAKEFSVVVHGRSVFPEAGVESIRETTAWAMRSQGASGELRPVSTRST